MSSLLDLVLFLLIVAGHAPLLLRAIGALRKGYVHLCGSLAHWASCCSMTWD